MDFLFRLFYKERVVLGAVALLLVFFAVYGFSGTSRQKLLRGKPRVGALGPEIVNLMAFDENHNDIPDFWEHVAANILGLSAAEITSNVINENLEKLGEYRISAAERESIFALLRLRVQAQENSASASNGQ